MQTSASKVLASIFWDVQGILFFNHLEKGKTVNSEYYITLLMHLKEEIVKKQPQMKKKKCSFTNTMHHFINRLQRWQNYMNCTSNCFRTPTLFSRSGPQWLPAVCRPQGKEIWLQWRSDIGNWGVFWSQRQIVQQKRHWIVREALESVYHPRRRLCWWIKLNFAKKLLFY